MRSAKLTRRLAAFLLAAGPLVPLGLLAPGSVVAQEVAARPPAPAPGPALSEVALWAGRFDAFETEATNEAGLELRYRPFWRGSAPFAWRLEPAWGAMATDEHAAYLWAGFRLELPLGRRWRLVPQSGAGLYRHGDDKDLGGPIEFRSGLELDLRVGAAHDLGLVLYHLSNAVLYEHNPGEESLVLIWTWRRGGR